VLPREISHQISLRDMSIPFSAQALNDSTSVSKQEVAVVAMGKLVSSLTMVTEEPYSKYPGLFEGLVKVRLALYLSIYLSVCVEGR
jgi:hypothetical protein